MDSAIHQHYDPAEELTLISLLWPTLDYSFPLQCVMYTFSLLAFPWKISRTRTDFDPGFPVGIFYSSTGRYQLWPCYNSSVCWIGEEPLKQSQKLVYQRVLLDITKGTVSLQEDKVSAAREHVQLAFSWVCLSIFLCLNILGTFSSCIPMVRWAQWYLRSF